LIDCLVLGTHFKFVVLCILTLSIAVRGGIVVLRNCSRWKSRAVHHQQQWRL